MDDFLNLESELTFDGFELRQLLEGRSALEREIRSIDPNTCSEEDGRRFDALSDRFDAVDAEVESRQSRERRNERRRALENRSMNPGQRQLAPAPNMNPRGPEPPTEDRNDPVANPDGGKHKYSLLRAVSLRANQRPLDGLEAEVHQEIERRSGKPAQGLYVPWTLPVGEQRSRLPNVEYRDFDTTAGAGAIPTVTAPTIIGALRNRMVMGQMGAVVLDDMVGDFELPKQTGTGAAYWVTEGNAPTESGQTVGQVPFSPSTVGCYTDITRKLTKQVGSASAERFVREDLTTVLRLELDRVGLNGSGSGAEPEGILQNGSVSVVAIGANGGAVDWPTVVDLETEVADNNADLGSLGYVTSAKGRGAMKKTEKASGTAKFIWDGMDLNGYRGLASNQIPTNLTKGSGTNLTALLFGNFADAVYAMWGALDLMVDPFTFSNTGTIRIVILADADFQLRRAESFSACVDIDPAA